MPTLRDLDLDALPVVACVQQPAFADWLRLFGVQHVIAPSLRNPQSFLDPEGHDAFQAVAARQPHGHGRRLYVSRMGQARAGATSRIFMNEVACAAALARLGFDAIEPEGMDPAAQVAAFAAADIVVGPAGGGMFNAVFCRPGTQVLGIESERYWLYDHAGLFSSCGLRYGLFAGQVDLTDPRTIHRRWTVNVPALLGRVSRMIAAC